MINSKLYVIELLVRNHAGVMSHITGLFSRRGFNLEGILCGKIGDGTTSKMYLVVKQDDFIDQIIKQLKKLHDILEVTLYDDFDPWIFDNIDTLLKAKITNN